MLAEKEKLIETKIVVTKLKKIKNKFYFWFIHNFTHTFTIFFKDEKQKKRDKRQRDKYDNPIIYLIIKYIANYNLWFIHYFNTIYTFPEMSDKNEIWVTKI